MQWQFAVKKTDYGIATAAATVAAIKITTTTAAAITHKRFLN